MLKFLAGLILLLTFNFSMYFYVILKLFSIKNRWIIGIVALIISTLIIPSSIMVEERNNIFTQLFYIFTGLLMGVFFITFTVLIFLQIIARLFPMGEKLRISTVLISSLLIIYSFLNARNVSVKTVEVDGFEKRLKIVQISDLHLKPLTSSGSLYKIVNRINLLNPDIVVITGDMVSQDTLINSETFHPLKEINTRTYFVTGNHEHYIGEDKVAKMIENAGIIVLRDKTDVFNGIQIIGVDYRRNRDEIHEILSEIKIDNNKPVLLLSHVPLDPRNSKIKLTISGHTHYGQIVPFNLVVRLSTKFLKGLYKINNGYIYVSPGTGTWGPPMRLGSKNEITEFYIK